MIQPVIRHFISPDADLLDEFEPDDGECFSVLIQMMIGPHNGPGEESFDVEVVTPRWLEQLYPNDAVITGENRIVVRSYSWPATSAYLRKRVAACAADDWASVARRISKFARWEFENYEPDVSTAGR